MEYIYLAYTAHDRDFALVLMGELEKRGIRVYMDLSGLRGQAEWTADTEKALHRASAAVAVLSPDSSRSDVFTYEWTVAMTRGIPVLPIAVVPTPAHPRLLACSPIDGSVGGPASVALLGEIAARLQAARDGSQTTEDHTVLAASGPSARNGQRNGFSAKSKTPLRERAGTFEAARPAEPDALGRLAMLLNASDTEVQIAAAAAMANLNSAASAGPLEASLKETRDINVRAAIIHTLATISGDALDYAILTGDLGTSYPDKRAGLARMLRRAVFFSENSVEARAWELRLPENEVRARCEAMARRYGLEIGWAAGERADEPEAAQPNGHALFPWSAGAAELVGDDCRD